MDVNNRLKVACATGDLKEVKYLLCEQHADVRYEDGAPLICASNSGRLDIVSYLLTSYQLLTHADIHDQNDEALHSAARNGHLSIVTYLLTSNELEGHADISAGSYRCLMAAVANGHMPVVQYLLTSPDLQHKADINAQDGLALHYACKHNRVNIVKYLLAAPELKQHAKVDNSHVVAACNCGKTEIADMVLKYRSMDANEIFIQLFLTDVSAHSDDMLKHLIMMGHLKITKEILAALNEDTSERSIHVKSWFVARDFNDNLSAALNKQPAPQSSKVKI